MREKKRMAVGVRLAAAVGLAAVALSMTGCGSRGQTVEQVYSVSGTVRIGGRPLADGMLSFLPADGVGGSSATVVKDGAFQCSVAAGSKVVRIDDMKTGRSYGGESGTLTAEVEPAAENTFEFDVRSRNK